MPAWSELRTRRSLIRAGGASLGALALSACGDEGPKAISAPQTPRTPSPASATRTPEPSPTPEPRTREVSIGKSILLHHKDTGLLQGEMYVPASYSTPERVFVRNSQGQVQEVDEKTGSANWTWPDKKGQVIAANNQLLCLFDEETSRTYILDAGTKQQHGFIAPDRLNVPMLKQRYRYPSYVLDDKVLLPKAEDPHGGVNFGYAIYDKTGKEEKSTAPQDIVWVQDVIGNRILYIFVNRNIGWFLNFENYKEYEYVPATHVGTRAENGGATVKPLYVHNTSRLLAWGGGFLRLIDSQAGKRIAEFPANQPPVRLYPPVTTTAGQEFSFYQTQEGFWAYPTNPGDPAFRRIDARPLLNPRSGWIFEQLGTGVLKAYGHGYSHNTQPTFENAEVQALKFHGVSGNKLVLTNWDDETGAKTQNAPFRIYFLDQVSGKETKLEVPAETNAKDLPKLVLRDKATFVVSKTIEKLDPVTGKSVEVLYRGQNEAKCVVDTGRDVVHAEFLNKLVVFKTT